MALQSQEAARGGVTVSATFNYQLTPKMGTNTCIIGGKPKVQNCVEVYHGWPSNYVTIDTWYQLRSVEMCCTLISGIKTCVVSLHSYYSDINTAVDSGTSMLTILAYLCTFLTHSPVELIGVAGKSGMTFPLPGTLEANQMC